MTSDQLAAGVSNALAAHDVKAAVEILEVLAMVDPERAEIVYQTLRVALHIADEAR